MIYFIWLGLILLSIIFYFYYTLPDIDFSIESSKNKPTIIIRDSLENDVHRIGSSYGDFIPLGSLPSSLHAAILSIEDRRFYDHYGIDLKALMRALIANFKAGYIVQGGSTITQQVAKNLFLSPERKVSRKIREALLALWLERNFTKDQILSLYLNRVYLGSGIYGVDAASQEYFNSSVENLSLYQSAMIAGLVKAPSRYNPKTNINAAKDRTEIVLRSMVDAGYITFERYKSLDRNNQITIKEKSNNTAEYFSDWILNQIENTIGNFNQDLIITTTIDMELQSNVEKIVETILNNQSRDLMTGQVSLVVLSNQGEVKSMIGGKNYSKSQFNRAVNAKRQPGSAFKPFVYLAALEAGMLPEDIVEDIPIDIDGWRPKNFSGEYEGEVTLEEALSRSINTVAVRVAKKAGVEAIIDVARRFGFISALSNDLGLALGTSEVSLLELTSAYAPFSNGGTAINPYGIISIRTSSGKILYNRKGSGLGKVVSSPYVGLMNQMLSRTITDGTGRNAKISRPVAGKTGTSQNFRDAWFIGYSADFITGVWVGNDNGKGMKNVTGGTIPASIWKDVMLSAHSSYTVSELPGNGTKQSHDSLSRFIERILGRN